ncbi:hypothetical protein Tco_1206726, partial [Tanacetum coccineum]
MQEELHKFERLEVWELVPPPDKEFVITLKWIYKVKLDVEKSKLDEEKEGKAVDPSYYRGSTYQKALKCCKKDLSVSKRNRTSGALVSEGFFDCSLTAFADADHA